LPEEIGRPHVGSVLKKGPLKKEYHLNKEGRFGNSKLDNYKIAQTLGNLPLLSCRLRGVRRGEAGSIRRHPRCGCTENLQQTSLAGSHEKEQRAS
jgi:hypothetical protein